LQEWRLRVGMVGRVGVRKFRNFNTLPCPTGFSDPLRHKGSRPGCPTAKAGLNAKTPPAG